MVDVNTNVELQPGLDLEKEISQIYQVVVQENEDGELYLDFPPELLDSLDLQTDDVLVWNKNEENDYSWYITPLRKAPKE